jgi:hypothetical protein
MQRTITYEEFSREVSKWWNTEMYTYGSVQFPARKVLNELKLKGITNAEEMYEEYKRNRGDSFWYAGD